MRIASALVVVATLAVATCAARPATACSCGAETLDEAFARADVVFRGTLVERGPNCDFTCFWDGDGWDVAVVPFRYDVTEVWKGEPSAAAILVAYVDSCTVAPTPVGTEQLVFARDDDETGQRVFSRCGGPTDVAFASDDLTALGEGASPSAGEAPGFMCAAPYQESEPASFVAPSGCQVPAQPEEQAPGDEEAMARVPPGEWGCTGVVVAPGPLGARELASLVLLAGLASAHRRRGRRAADVAHNAVTAAALSSSTEARR